MYLIAVKDNKLIPLLKIVWGGGHGFGTTSEQTLETQTQELAFLAKVLGLDVGRLKGAGEEE